MLEDYVAVDLEMTGLKATRDRILEIGAIRVRRHEVTATYHTMVKPGCKIPDKVVELTGITDEMAAEGVEPREAVEGFLEFCQGLPLVGHNIYFDYSFLKQNAINFGLELEVPLLDTLKLSRKFLQEPEKKSLDALCEYFRIERSRNHRALEDAMAAGKVFEILAENYGELEPEAFEPKTILCKVKKQGPATPRQKKYLKELAEYHKIELPVAIQSLTKNEASRLTDKILSKYGRMMS